MLSWVPLEVAKHRKEHIHTQAMSHKYMSQKHEYYCLSLPDRLLDVIAGRKDPAGLKEGNVLVDGKVVTSDLRLSSAYVVQVNNSNTHTHTHLH